MGLKEKKKRERESTTHREEFDVRQVEFGGSQAVKSDALQRGIKSVDSPCNHEAALPLCVVAAPHRNLFTVKSG